MRDTVRKVTFLVGNGFDINVLSSLGQSPTTRYDHFYNFVKFAHPDCKNILLLEMEKRRKQGHKNWSDFENIIDDLSEREETNDELNLSVLQFQDYFSEFLNNIVTPSFLRYLDTYAKERQFFRSSIQCFLGDLNELITRNNLARTFEHNQILDIKFLNFNYTSLLDNLVYLDKSEFNPKQYPTSGNNFNFHVNPHKHKGVHRNNPDKHCKLQVEVLHPHGIQSIPRSILFGNGRVDEVNYFSKPYWAQYDRKYEPILEETELFIVYGMSLGVSDKWWWEKIYSLLSKSESTAQMIIYNFLGSKKDYENDNGQYSEEVETKRVVQRFYKLINKVSSESQKVSTEKIFIVNYFSDDQQPILFNMTDV